MSKYLDEAKAIISQPNDAEAAIARISELDLPDEASPLESLVYGESQQLEAAREFKKLSPEDSEDPTEVAKEILNKLMRYFYLLDDGYDYTMHMLPFATYSHFLENQMKPEYLAVLGTSKSKSIKDAYKEAKNWEKKLQRKLPLFEGEHRQCVLVSVKPTYRLVAEKGNEKFLISEGTVEFGDERDINTRVNNFGLFP